MILHPAQHGSGHLGLDARHIGARPGERLLDLIHKHDHPRGFATQKRGRQESLDVFATADLIERLAAAPDCKSWRLLNRLALPLPQPVEIEPFFDRDIARTCSAGNAAKPIRASTDCENSIKGAIHSEQPGLPSDINRREHAG